MWPACAFLVIVQSLQIFTGIPGDISFVLVPLTATGLLVAGVGLLGPAVVMAVKQHVRRRLSKKDHTPLDGLENSLEQSCAGNVSPVFGRYYLCNLGDATVPVRFGVGRLGMDAGAGAGQVSARGCRSRL